MPRLAPALLLLALALPARADPVRLDLVCGPLITSSRITGLGGAFAGVAEGIDGVVRNPAALANRPHDSTSWFDWALTFDWFVSPGSELDWDGDGLVPGRFGAGSGEFRAYSLGLMTQLDPFGLGLLGNIYGWTSGEATFSYADVLFGGAWAFAEGELIVGLAAEIATLNVTTGVGDTAAALDLAGPGFGLGLLYRPIGAPWRLGVRFRTTTHLEPEAGATAPASVLGLPGDEPVLCVVPWQLAAGVSYFLAADPRHRYNPALRQAPPALADRRYLLVSAELVVLGATEGTSLESLVAGEPRRAGLSPSLGVHLGAEGEVLDGRLRARFGTYLEPRRVDGLAAHEGPRLHLTGGVELRLVELVFDWKATLGFDLAPGWENLTVGVGFWD